MSTLQMLSKCFVLGLFIVTISNATIINVPSDHPTIQAGIDAANDKDTVLVDTGKYVENINFNGKNIVLGSHFLTTNDTNYISKTIIDEKVGFYQTIGENKNKWVDRTLMDFATRDEETIVSAQVDVV